MTTLLLLLFVLLAALAWIRLAPHDRDRWHVDPADADEDGGLRLIGLDAPRYPAGAAEVLEAFRAIALDEPGVRHLDGSVDEGMMTFVARSPVIGLCDYITVKAVDEGRAAKLAIAARSGRRLFGGGDPARLDRWLQEMEHTFRR